MWETNPIQGAGGGLRSQGESPSCEGHGAGATEGHSQQQKGVLLTWTVHWLNNVHQHEHGVWET